MIKFWNWITELFKTKTKPEIMKFTFLALSKTTDVEITAPIGSPIHDEFLMLFVNDDDIDRDNMKINIQSEQKNTEEFRLKMNAFIEKYKTSNIKVFQLRNYFRELEEDETFLLWSSKSLNPEIRENFYHYLMSIKEGKSFEDIKKQMDDLFSDIKKAYRIITYDGSQKQQIGEKDKTRRVCRFCSKDHREVNFNSVAHAISESLGNKNIILFDECDQCNSNFGSAQGIENSLISYLKFYGIFFGIRGKNGIPKLKGSNFELSNDGQIQIKHIINNDSELIDDLNAVQIQLNTFESIKKQDIYRTLCKYAISTIDSDDLPMFTETIKWINGENNSKPLPEISILPSYQMYKDHPSILVYLKKDNDVKLPFAVAEFHYTFLTFVYIIPYSNLEEPDYSDPEKYQSFWKFFKHFSLVEGWDTQDFSDNERRKFSLSLNFNRNDNPETNN